MEYFIKVNVVICLVIHCFNLIHGKDFTVSYTKEEETGPDYYLGNVARDSGLIVDNSSDITLKYSLLTEGNPHALLFSINERTSSLYTSFNLDRDDLCDIFTVGACVLSFEVAAQAQLEKFFEKIKVKVTLIDINDNVPTFYPNESFVEISENSQVGTSLTIPGAVDGDSGNNSVQFYRIDPEGVPFRLEEQKYSDGRTLLTLTVTQDLNRELANKYVFKILAIDGGDTPRIGTALIHVKILDVNDNAPKFSRSVFNLTIPEDINANKVILKFNATDPDEGEDGRVLYWLSSHQSEEIRRHFRVDKITGELSVIKDFTEERNQMYRIIILATDNSSQPLISQAQVFVTIKDTRNEPPVIKLNLLSQTRYVEALESAVPGTVLAIVMVTDPDSGDSGVVSCSVNDDHFKLIRYDDVYEYNFVVEKELDREVTQWHNITVTCTDFGAPPLKSYATFSVRVLDMNDNPPTFNKPVYTAEVEENGPMGIKLLQVTATDVDVVSVSNFTFSVDSEIDYPGYFSINSKNGDIFLNVQLDREKVPNSVITFKVFADDGDVPPLTGTAVVEIKVKDVNDNIPVFSKSTFELLVPENQLPNISIGKVIASDADEDNNGRVSFSMSPEFEQMNLPFKVLPNGTIIGTTPLNREEIDRYHFKVIASDSGHPSFSNFANVTVKVEDLNDNPPIIIFPSTDGDALSINYDTLPNTVFGSIRANDIDDGENAKLSFFIQNRNLTALFSLNQFTGQLTLNRALVLSDIGTYDIPLRIQDNGQPPRFQYRTLTIEVTDDRSDDSGTSVSQIKYFTIAIAISCVTIVLSVLIILAICLIKRNDKNREKYPESVTTNSTTDTDPSNPDLRINGIYTREILQKSLQSDASMSSQDTLHKPPRSDSTLPRADNQLQIISTMDKMPRTTSLSPSRLQPEALSSEVAIWDWSENDPVVGIRRQEPPVYMYQQPPRQTFVQLYHDQDDFTLPSGVTDITYTLSMGTGHGADDTSFLLHQAIDSGFKERPLQGMKDVLSFIQAVILTLFSDLIFKEVKRNRRPENYQG